MDEKTKNTHKVKFYVERESFWVQAAVILMLLSAAFRLIGCWGLWGDSFYAATQIALPLICNVLFILCILLPGKRFFGATALPFLLGVVFFIIKSFSFDSWLRTVLCIMLYLLAAVLYTATAFGVLRTKWLLVPLFALPFVYHIFVEDVPALRSGELSFSAGMQEMSVLCVLLALLSTVFAMKKNRPDVPMEKEKEKGKATGKKKGKSRTGEPAGPVEAKVPEDPAGAKAPEDPVGGKASEDPVRGKTPESPTGVKASEGQTEAESVPPLVPESAPTPEAETVPEVKSAP